MVSITPNLWSDGNACEAVSFFVACADQAEVDHYWDALLAGGGQPSQCGWLKDRFGLSWQVIPTQMGDYLGGPDPESARRAMEAMMEMVKLDLNAMRVAYEGETEGGQRVVRVPHMQPSEANVRQSPLLCG